MQLHPGARQILFFGAVPSTTLVVTAAATVIGLAVGITAGWPLWAVALTIVIPVMPIVLVQIAWTEENYPGLALFYVLVVAQSGHFVEHVWQMIQIHALGMPSLVARGAFGTFDIEWVHFLWNTFVIVVVAVLLTRFRLSGWLIALALAAGWHEVEHAYIMVGFLRTGAVGGPGLLAFGGAIGGGLPLTRPDLHFIYNLVETAFLIAAFVYQARRSVFEAGQRALRTSYAEGTM